MYFSENLEYCTMTDVSFCKDGVGVERERLFYLFRNERASPAPPPAFSPYPSGGDPNPQCARTDCTAQAAAQAVPDARQTMQGKVHTPRPWAPCTGLHSIPDRPRLVDRDGAGAGEYKLKMLHTQRFCMLVRLILNILLTCTFNRV